MCIRVCSFTEEGNNDEDPCSDVFSGNEAFSEVETLTLSQYLLTLKGKIEVYLGFHSSGQLLMFPYGYTKEHLVNYDTLVSST